MKNKTVIPVGTFLTTNFFIIYAILAYLSFKYNFPGIFRSILWLLLVFFNYNKIRDGGLTNGFVFSYILLGILSIVGYIQQPYPFEWFLVVFFESYIPIIFYFIGYNELSRFPVFYNRCIVALSFIFVVGIIWLITTPDWYVSKQLDKLSLHSYYTEETLMYARFASFLDSYHTGNYGVFLLCISLGGLNCSDQKKQKLFYSCTAILAFVSIMLSQQRVSMYTSILIIVFYVYFLNKHKSRKTLYVFIAIVILTILFMSKYDISSYVSIDSITERFSSDSSKTMVSERSSTWVYAINNQRNYLFGHGVGGGGHLAHAHGIEPTVRDGSYFKILLETGIFSLLCFLIIIISSLMKGIKNINKYLVEFLILFFCTLSLLGANIIDFPYIIAIMWYVLGRISNSKQYI